MLAKPHRFHGYNALNFAHKQGRVVRGNQITLKYARNDRRQTYRVAVVVSKKVSKSAVTRNRIRRRVYEAVRLQPPVTGPYDLIFMVYSEDAASVEYQALEQTIGQLLRKANVV